MSRALWFAAGAGAGLYATLRARRAAEALSVEGLQDRIGATVVGLRMFRDEVAQGKADAETRLRERMGAALTAGSPADDDRPAPLPTTNPTRHPSTSEKEAGTS
ncbi:hypothetical protein GCM10023340_34920 [Nocardioides marinquilinus]|uniref:Secreted protein n=1 Tax=Nocardioides marinquilinus TaxID=1210400 RepID=A0ABP9PW57_9ACTN